MNSSYIFHYCTAQKVNEILSAPTIVSGRGEKKLLNTINTRAGDASIKYFLPDKSNPAKRRDRVATPQEKIFIMVRDAQPPAAHCPACDNVHVCAWLCHALSACLPLATQMLVMSQVTSKTPVVACLQVNEALNDNAPPDSLDYSMRQELEQVMRLGERVANCMSK